MNYSKIAEENGVKLMWSSKALLNRGYNVAGEFAHYPNGVIFIQDNLSDKETEDVFNHELGQLLFGDKITEFSAPALHSSSEAKGNEYMVHKKIVDWFDSLTVIPDFVPVENVMQTVGIDPKFRTITEQEIREVMLHSYS